MSVDTPGRWHPTSGPSPTDCQNCGAAVSSDARRVWGDEDGRLHACPSCVAYTDLEAGAGYDPDYTRADRYPAASSGGGR